MPDRALKAVQGGDIGLTWTQMRKALAAVPAGGGDLCVHVVNHAPRVDPDTDIYGQPEVRAAGSDDDVYQCIADFQAASAIEILSWLQREAQVGDILLTSSPDGNQTLHVHLIRPQREDE